MTGIAGLVGPPPTGTLEASCQASLDALRLYGSRTSVRCTTEAAFGLQTLDGNLALRERLNGNAGGRWLCRAALRQLMEREEPIEPTSRALGTAMIHLTQFRILPGVRFKLSELARQLRNAL